MSNLLLRQKTHQHDNFENFRELAPNLAVSSTKKKFHTESCDIRKVVLAGTCHEICVKKRHHTCILARATNLKSIDIKDARN